MFYKPDWDEAKRRIEAWHKCELVDRCCVAVTAPKEGVTPKEIPTPPTLEEQWTNADYLFERNEENFRQAFYGGEAAPIFRPNLGPHSFSVWLGGELTFQEETTWAEPCVESADGLADLHFRREHPLWRWMQETTSLAAERGKDKYLIAIGDIHGGGDCLSSLRGPDHFCMDLALHPDRVREGERLLRDMWFEVCGDLLARCVSAGQDGTCGFLGWGPGKTVPLQEDVFALISPQMAEEFFFPALIEQVEYLDSTIFHLDGPEALPVLDLLLDIPALQGIQWQPGAGHRPMVNWIPVLKKIQAAGKCLHISSTPDEVETILGEVSSKGLFLHTTCKSEREARDLLRKVEGWTHD